MGTIVEAREKTQKIQIQAKESSESIQIPKNPDQVTARIQEAKRKLYKAASETNNPGHIFQKWPGLGGKKQSKFFFP